MRCRQLNPQRSSPAFLLAGWATQREVSASRPHNTKPARGMLKPLCSLAASVHQCISAAVRTRPRSATLTIDHDHLAHVCSWLQSRSGSEGCVEGGPLSTWGLACSQDVEASGYCKRAFRLQPDLIKLLALGDGSFLVLQTSAPGLSILACRWVACWLATQSATESSTSFATRSAGAQVPAMERISASGLATESTSKPSSLRSTEQLFASWPPQQSSRFNRRWPYLHHFHCLDARGWQNWQTD